MIVKTQKPPLLVSAPSFWQLCARAILRLQSWKWDFTIPEEPKYVLIGAPHTSNWDLLYAVWLMQAAGVRPHFVGKASLFRPPLGILMRAWGGVPVERSTSNNFVQQMAEVFNQHDEFVLMVAPEGTRSQVDYWRTGFYYIALGAQVPIAMAYVDYSTRTVGIGAAFYPTGDIHADFVQIKAFYADKKGKYPEKQGEIRLKPE